MTVGISPKVSVPTLLGLAAAVALYLHGDTNTALTVGLAALGFGGAGFVAKPGEVDQGGVGPASDSILAEQTSERRFNE